MAAVFTFTPSVDFRQQNKLKTLAAQFGDGYSQRMQDGINNEKNDWTVPFINQDLVTASAIDDFLRTAGTGDPTKGGNTYFLWTPPGSAIQYKVTCEEWDIQYSSHISRTINAIFKRVYDL
jgi:phage-related protein